MPSTLSLPIKLTVSLSSVAIRSTGGPGAGANRNPLRPAGRPLRRDRRHLGELTGRADGADKLARYAEDTLKTILGRIEPVATAARPRVYYARGPRGLTTGLGGSINVETIELIGRNVAGETQGGLANVSIEQILVWNPEVIVTIDQEFAAAVRNDPSWASVKAVRDNRLCPSRRHCQPSRRSRRSGGCCS